MYQPPQLQQQQQLHGRQNVHTRLHSNYHHQHHQQNQQPPHHQQHQQQQSTIPPQSHHKSHHSIKSQPIQQQQPLLSHHQQQQPQQQQPYLKFINNQPKPSYAKTIRVNGENLNKKHTSKVPASAKLTTTNALQAQLPPSAPSSTPVVSAAAVFPILSSSSSSQSSQSSNAATAAVSATQTVDKNGIIEVSAAGLDGVPATTLVVETLANSKEKTPMCLVNELARYNKIEHQYRLTDEQGPPHKKHFTVTLKLGEEEYTSGDASIKKAQHSAAATAIENTKYKHPPAKVNRLRPNGRNGASDDDLGNITPTVELNALAMKRGETTNYHVEPPQAVQNMNAAPPPPQRQIPGAGSGNYPWYYGQGGGVGGGGRGGMGRGRGFHKDHRQHTNFSNYPPPGTNEDPYKVTLEIGSRSFLGIGSTLQAARHDAAAKALEVLKPLTSETENQDNADDENSDLKSPISLVHEMVLKRNLTVSFKVQSEKGPPHMKTFVTLCIVGDITTEGEGNGKKLSKKRSAETMLAELRKLPPPPPPPDMPAAATAASSSSVSSAAGGPTTTTAAVGTAANGQPTTTTTARAKTNKRKPQIVKKKTRNLIKENAEEDTNDVNPISRLIHIAQSNKAPVPVYTLIEERGAPRRREFIMEVVAVQQKAQGVGSTKKLAKRQAAENLLELLANSTDPAVRALCQPIGASSVNEAAAATLSGGDSAAAPSAIATTTATLTTNTTTAIAPIDSVASDTVEISAEAIRPAEQLDYLAKLLGFQIQFSDFNKGNHGEFLTLITMSTDPPQLCHGAGISKESSHDQAAVRALNMLSALGLDNVVPNKSSTTTTPPVTTATTEKLNDDPPPSIVCNGVKN